MDSDTFGLDIEQALDCLDKDAWYFDADFVSPENLVALEITHTPMRIVCGCGNHIFIYLRDNRLYVYRQKVLKEE